MLARFIPRKSEVQKTSLTAVTCLAAVAFLAAACVSVGCKAKEASAPESGSADVATKDAGEKMAGKVTDAKNQKASAEGTTTIGALLVKIPSDWESVPVTSSMRRAHYRLANDPDKGKPGQAELIVYHFGQGGAGGTEANLTRWYSQFSQPDKRETKDVAERTTVKTAAGTDAVVVDVAGRYVAAMQPGAEEKNNEANYRMLAAIVPGPDGPYYFKFVGPNKKVAAQKNGFVAAIESIKNSSSAVGGPSHP